jgi:chemotaxis signal transduction protein
MAGQRATPTRRPLRVEQVILFRIAGQPFAVSAAAVQEIRSTDNLARGAVEVSRAELKKVSHTIRRDKRTVYVVHGGALFGLPPARATLLFLMRGTRTALLVDGIERMTAISRLFALPQAFCGDERLWYRGMALIDDTIVPVVNPHGLLSPSEIELLDAAFAGTTEDAVPVEGAATA